MTISRRVNDTVFDPVAAGVVMPYANSFGEVPEGKPLLYLNSLMNVSFALNERNFAGKFGVHSAGPEWRVVIRRAKKP